MIRFLIKEIRTKKDMTLKYLNFQTKISISYLSEIENNQVMNPSFDKIVKIAKALEVTPNDIYYNDNDLESLKHALEVYIACYGMQDKRIIGISQMIDDLVIRTCAKKHNEQ